MNYKISQEHIASLHDVFKNIIELELNAGNEIDETWKNWPKNWIFIALKRPFIVKHHFKNLKLEYKMVNDPHYWYEEVKSESLKQCIICKFI